VTTRPRIHLPKVEFYITNVCNLTCTHCNRFNDYNFKGWQRWSDYEDTYRRWADLITVDKITILGGEPLLNSDIIDWMLGLSEIWQQPIQILSNGTRLNHTRGLYKHLAESGSGFIGISVHNTNELNYLLDEIDKFLTHPLTRVDGKANNDFGADIVISDVNHVRIPLWIQNEFTTSSIIRNESGQLTLHNSDPLEAHDICDFVRNNNYHFIHGGLSKCGPAVLLPEFDKQMPLAISQEDRILLHSYQPLTLDNYEEYHEQFFRELDNPIAQCKFCPSSRGFIHIEPPIKK
jgi:organic radical activating enzyme